MVVTPVATSRIAVTPPFLLDTFNEGGNPLLSAHAPDIGGVWSLDAGSGNNMFLIAVGSCSMTAGGSVGYTNAAVPPGADYFAEVGMRADLGVSNTQSISIRKNVAALSRYEAQFVPPNVLNLNKVVGGVLTILDSGIIVLPIVANPPSIIRISALGTALAVLVNGAPTLSAVDAAIGAPGLVGFNGNRIVGQPLYVSGLNCQ